MRRYPWLISGLKQDGTVVAWGYNNYGQATVPVGLSNVIAIAAAEYHGMALVAPFAPTLAISLMSGTEVLSWPTNASGYVIESTPELASPNWEAATNAPAIVGDRYNFSENIVKLHLFLPRLSGYVLRIAFYVPTTLDFGLWTLDFGLWTLDSKLQPCFVRA
jgi:hypothetical protein